MTNSSFCILVKRGRTDPNNQCKVLHRPEKKESESLTMMQRLDLLVDSRTPIRP